MLRIECDNTIKVISGNAGFINFKCANYKLKENDIVFLKSKELGINIEVREFTEQGVAVINLEEQHTTREKGSYSYKIDVFTAEGIKDTVIIGKILII